MRVLTLAAALALAPILTPVLGPTLASTTNGVNETGRSPGPPIDRGSSAPDTNGAYSGGGLVLQGSPGGPAPLPQATAPAQSMAPQGANPVR